MNREMFTHPKLEEGNFYFPSESEEHEATWLQCPPDHRKQYDDLLPSWIQMAKALSTSQIVRMLVNSEKVKKDVSEQLKGVPNIEIYICPLDDFWIRDNGPIFVYNSKKQICVGRYKFTGWGNKYPYKNDCQVPRRIAQFINLPLLDLQNVMNTEGGAVQVDGNGTMFVCQASILNCNRNKGMKKYQAQIIFRKYYGVRQIIWLKGTYGFDVTDNHCDAVVKFPDPKTMLTMTQQDLIANEGMQPEDVKKIYNAVNADGEPYKRIILPLTQNGYDLQQFVQKQKGSYINCYCANKVVLVPKYDDPNDEVAFKIIQEAYPGRKVVGIPIKEVYYLGGMIHCITQQQPMQREKK